MVIEYVLLDIRVRDEQELVQDAWFIQELAGLDGLKDLAVTKVNAKIFVDEKISLKYLLC